MIGSQLIDWASAILNDRKRTPPTAPHVPGRRYNTQQCQSLPPFEVEILNAHLIMQRLDHRVESLVLGMLPVRRTRITKIDPTPKGPGRVHAAEPSDLIGAPQPVPRLRSVGTSLMLRQNDFRSEQSKFQRRNKQPMSECLESAASSGLIAARLTSRTFDLKGVIDCMKPHSERRFIDRLMECLAEPQSRFFR